MPSSITTSYGVDPFIGAANTTVPFERKLHNSYDRLTLTINNILEFALGFAFDANVNLDKLLKDSNFADRLESIKRDCAKRKPMVAIDAAVTDDGSINLLKTVDLLCDMTSITSPFGILVPAFSESIISFNNDNLSADFDANPDSVVKVQIGNCNNDFPMDKSSPLHAFNYMQYAFRVVPYFVEDSGIFKSYNNLKNVDIRNKIKYNVYFDITRLLHMIISLYDPSNLEQKFKNNGEDKNRDAYIKTGMNVFRSLPELIVRNIIAEVYTNHVSVRYGWKHFLACREKISDKFMKSDSISMIIRKSTHDYMSNNPTFEFDPNSGSILDVGNYGSYYDRTTAFYNPNMSFLWNLSSYITGNEFNIDTEETKMTISSLENILFGKAFSNYFTTSAIWYLENRNLDGGLTLAHRSYSRSFYQQYDSNTLLGATECIDNYVLKDFYKTIISEVTPFKISKPYVRTIKETKENLFFYYCKTRKKIWLEFEIALRTMIRVAAFDRSNLSKEANVSCLRYLTDILRTIFIYDFSEISSYGCHLISPVPRSSSYSEDLITNNVTLIARMFDVLSGDDSLLSTICPGNFSSEDKRALPFDTYISVMDWQEFSDKLRELIASLRRFNYIPSDI